MSRIRYAALLLPVAGLFLLPGLVPAAQQPAPPKNVPVAAKGKLSAADLAKRIDKHISDRWQKEGIKPVGPAANATFFRRLHLDLAGKIPGILDTVDFLSEDGPDRASVIDKLIDGESFADHFASIYRTMILANIENEQTVFLIGAFDNWVRKKLKENTPYDKMIHELLTASPNGGNNFGGPGGDMNNASPAAFYAVNENKPENLAGATARLFLGVKIECAQCHKHPFADWTRNQFWEFAAFYAQVGQNFGAPVDLAIDNLKPDQPKPIQPGSGEYQGPTIQIPKTDPAEFVKAKFLDGTAPKWKDGMDPRKVLADWVVAPENPYFAKMAVNYVWNYFYGIGLVDPVDDMGKHNPASHPELLNELAEQFVQSGYDLKYIMKAIVSSKIYQLSSAPLGQKASSDDEAELNRLFARMPLRQLTGEQLFDSLAEVMEYKVDRTRQGVPGLGMSPRDEFIAKFNSPESKRIDTHTSILQALHLMNGKFITNATSLEKNKTLQTIVAAGHRQTTKRIQTLYLVALSRMPRPEELERLTRYVNAGGTTGDRNEALADVFWAILNSAEFAMNQ